MKKILAALILFILLASPALRAEMLKNGGFETDANSDGVADFWARTHTDGVELIKEGAASYLKMTNKNPEYKGISQTIMLPDKRDGRITVKAKIKINDVVKGPQEWEMARVMVLFYDANGIQTGGWPELGRWQGSFDWAEKIAVINVPPAAKSVVIKPELSNCTGEMLVDDISMVPGSSISIPGEPDNFLINGSLEIGSTLPLYWGGWVNGAASFVTPGHKSPACFKMESPSKVYSMITQQVPLDTSKISSVTVSGALKTVNVGRGENNWEQARISIEFHDDKGRVGGWPTVTGELLGTSDGWVEMEREYTVPEGATSVIVQAGLLNASGTVFIDSLKLTAKNSAGKPVLPAAKKENPHKNWYAFEYEQDTYAEGAVIDMSGTLNAPAGRHGAIVINKEGGTSFEDGTKAVFWGTNLVAGDCFLPKEKADLMVKRLAKLGVNLVRLHHMDAPWAEPNIFDPSKNNTRSFSADSMDKLDYLIYSLKEAGIYVFLDGLVHRKLKAGDGIDGWEKIPNGMKEVIFLDKKLQELALEYALNLFNHKNKYTGLTYAEDPAVVFTEAINESSMFYFDRNKEVPAKYTAEADKQFNSFLKNKYGSMEKLKTAWQLKGSVNLEETEDFEKSTVKREGFSLNWDSWEKFGTPKCAGRSADTKEFYGALEHAFFSMMYDNLKKAGVKALIAGSNHWELWDESLKVNASFDFIDRHTYWDHPSGGWTMQENISFRNTPMIRNRANSVTELGHARISGKPFTVSEWNMLLPNQYRAGAPVIMAAYAGLQGWDAMMQFNFASHEWKDELEHFADFSRWPDTLSQWFIAALISRSGYVSESKEKTVHYVSAADALESASGSFSYVNSNLVSPLMLRAEKTFNVEKKSAPFNPQESRGAVLSMSKELYWNFSKGVFQANAPKLQGAAGFLSSEKELVFKNMRLSSSSKYASIFAVSLDNKPLNSSSKIVISAAGSIENSGAEYSPSRTSVIYGGNAPILIEPVISTCTLTLNPFKSVKVYCVDINGYKKEEYKNYTVTGNTLKVKTDENSRHFNYLAEVIR